MNREERISVMGFPELSPQFSPETSFSVFYEFPLSFQGGVAVSVTASFLPSRHPFLMCSKQNRIFAFLILLYIAPSLTR